METVWHSNKNLSQHLFTGVLYNQYSPPPGFCWDILCNDEPLVDDPESHSYNLDRRLSSFVSYVKGQAAHFKTNNVALTMGMDFHYSVTSIIIFYEIDHRFHFVSLLKPNRNKFTFLIQAAHAWFTNLDKLIKYVNMGTDEHGLHLVYSSPSCYLKGNCNYIS